MCLLLSCVCGRAKIGVGKNACEEEEKGGENALSMEEVGVETLLTLPVGCIG